MANKVTIDVEARFVDNVTGKTKSASKSVDDLGKTADNAQKKIDKLGKKKTKVSIDADDKASKKITDVDSKVKKLKKSKANVVLDADDKASNKIKKILGKVKDFSGKVYRATVEINDSKAMNTIRKITDGGKKLVGKTWQTAVKVKDYATAPLTKIKNMLFSIQSLVLAITAGLAAKQFVINPINLADAYSSAQIGFSTLLGESTGQQMMNELDQFAKETPFKASQVIAQTQRMLAMGWDVDNIIDDMETIGDAAAATGKGSMGLEQIVLALSQIKTKGRLSTEELNQLAEAGIAAKKYLAEGLGYGTGDEGIAKMTKDLENGAIASDAALKALLSGMKEYQGMMDRTANETVAGLASQIQDTFEINVFRRWGQGLQDGAKKAFGSVVTLLGEADGALNEFGDTLYELGASISNWSAEKFENAVKRITDITGSFEFQKAGLGEKISMLWKGVITDPLREWWEGGGQAKTAKTAGEIGAWMGKTLSSIFKGLLGMTDILDENKVEASGASVAQSFAQGFVDNFDVSGITQKFVDAVGNVWSALPAWGKILLGGYMGGKTISGITGGIVNIVGGIGGLAKSGKKILNMGKGFSTFLGGGGTALGGAGTLGAGALSALGLGAIAGGVTTALGAGHIGSTAYQAYEGYKEGDDTKFKSNSAKAISTSAGMAGGAFLGFQTGAAVGTIGGPLGTLIGAGLGTAIGWFAGDKIAKNIEAAKYESEEMKAAIKDADMSAEDLALTFEKSVWQNMKDNFGAITLSMAEIERLSDQIVWGNDIGSYDTFTSSVQAAEESLKSLQSASEDTNRWMWKAGLGVTFNDNEIESFIESFDQYIASAQSYLDNKHYEFTAAVSLLVDPESEGGKDILDSGNAFFMGLQDELSKLGSELSDTLKISLSDGVISLDESAEIANLQEQIASITQKVADAESSAQIDLIKLKFGGGNVNIDSESFDAFMQQMQTTIDERMQASDEAFVASVSAIKLQLEDGNITEDEYNSQLQTLVEQYGATVDSLKAEVQNVELDIIDDAYGDILGEDAKARMQQAISDSLAQGIQPKDWTQEEARQFLGADDLSAEVAGAMSQMLGSVAEQMQALSLNETMVTKIQSSVPESIDVETKLNVKADANVNKVDTTNLDKEFGLPDTLEKDVSLDINGEKNVKKVNLNVNEFGIPNTLNKTVTVNITGKANYSGDFGGLGRFRGGIVGGSSSMRAFARGGIAGYTDGGMVRGGAQLITVAEEGNPEMIIPLSSQRRGRALKLWAQAGHMMDVPGFSRGGMTGGNEDEGIRFGAYSGEGSAGGQNISVDVGGVTVQINVEAGGGNVAEAIRAQSGEIAETVAGILADAFGAQFENTPTRGGVA